MRFSLTIPQLYYDLIARVVPGGLFLVAMRLCLMGTGLDPSRVLGFQSETSLGVFFEGLRFLALAYVAGWLLRALAWPKLQPKESRRFRMKYQRVRLLHPESGFRLVKLRAEARFLEAGRSGMYLAGAMSLAAWALRETRFVNGGDFPRGAWLLRVVVPVLVGALLQASEPQAWRRYRGNVRKLHHLVVKKRYGVRSGKAHGG